MQRMLQGAGVQELWSEKGVSDAQAHTFPASQTYSPQCEQGVIKFGEMGVKVLM